jgi:hypothetical protein
VLPQVSSTRSVEHRHTGVLYRYRYRGRSSADEFSSYRVVCKACKPNEPTWAVAGAFIDDKEYSPARPPSDLVSVTVVLPKLSLPKRKVGCLVSRLACLALAGALQASMHGETGARCGGGRPPAGVRVRVSRAPSPVGLVAINHRAAEPEDGEAEEIRDGVTWRSRPGAVSCVPN